MLNRYNSHIYITQSSNIYSGYFFVQPTGFILLRLEITCALGVPVLRVRMFSRASKNRFINIFLSPSPTLVC